MFAAKTLDVETLEMVTYLVMVMVEVRVEASSAMARRGRSAIATMVVSCIATRIFPSFPSLCLYGQVQLRGCLVATCARLRFKVGFDVINEARCCDSGAALCYF